MEVDWTGTVEAGVEAVEDPGALGEEVPLKVEPMGPNLMLE